MSQARQLLEVGAPVTHPRHGVGRVMVDSGATVVVRFGSSIENVLAQELTELQSLARTLRDNALGDGADALSRAQALAIASTNDQWGVFSRSRVQLLPHQLWVCHKVNQHWPFRWLVADDVGLGKTVECGLVLMPLLASGRVRRLLILAPAKLVPQWQSRLRKMFDIRLQAYVAQADAGKLDFWATAPMVVASFHTLRDDRRGARTRLLEAEPWDLVVVDEAHHLSAEERSGETLGYSLLRELEERRKINSLLFFTGTPHRGKDFGFFALMQLVRPDLFNPEEEAAAQLALLPQVMIRNNKATVTDLQGEKLFKPVTVNSREFSYTDAEQRFYRTLSEFIVDGRAYASTLDGRAQTARMLVLVTLQKLAASSIAAIRNALIKRRAMLGRVIHQVNQNQIELPDDADTTLDDVAAAEEKLPISAAVTLTQDEVRRLDELIALCGDISPETKIERLLSMIEEDFPPGEPVLLFTEYKATQALVINALHKRFGFGAATFINGDERLDNIRLSSGENGTSIQEREAAAQAFNDGKVRFLVSTEAGGEGIDLQERCATLVHVDMPWNPMRLHQRVGRLSRYGQSRPVSVFILRNPETVEARIWDLLNEKLTRIQAALSSVMEEREDICQLVIGMTGNDLFNELFSGASGLPRENLKSWFDNASATLGGRDVIETVRAIFGNVTRFDFQQVGKDLPKVDLPDIQNFFEHAVGRHGRRVFHRDGGLEIKTPEEWKARSYAIRDKYEGLVFDRNLVADGPTRMVGVGHVLFDTALEEAKNLPVFFACLKGLAAPLLVIAVDDEITGTGARVNRLIFGATQRDEDFLVLRDWELLKELNKLEPTSGQAPESAAAIAENLLMRFAQIMSKFAPQMQRPAAWPEMLLVPGAASSL